MRAVSCKQPYAERIARGTKRVEYRTWRAPCLVGKDLLLVASKGVVHGYKGEPRGVAVCVVRVEAIRGEPGAYGWVLSNPRRVAPIAVRGWASIYHVSDRRIRFVK